MGACLAWALSHGMLRRAQRALACQLAGGPASAEPPWLDRLTFESTCQVHALYASRSLMPVQGRIDVWAERGGRDCRMLRARLAAEHRRVAAAVADARAGVLAGRRAAGAQPSALFVTAAHSS
eukprot:353090-Chlamydomonas_euryale.AAC.13